MKINKIQETRYKQSQAGQVIVILLLLMLVALSIGLALTQKSVTDVATSTQTEQSQRAFSAAEAGIEKALTGTIFSGTSFQLSNEATANVDVSAKLPVAGTGAAIEYPPIGRETTAQFWFTDPGNENVTYNNSSVDLYFGNENTTSDKPAVEVKIVMKSNNQFWSKAYYYDSDSGPTRAGGGNNFTPVSGLGSGCGSVSPLLTILGTNRKFYCKQTIGPIEDMGTPAPGDFCPSATCKLILARVRFLYINENHNLALAPLGAGAEFPPQAQIYNATGIAGQSERQLQAFKIVDVVPPWFDFAVFSVLGIEKQ